MLKSWITEYLIYGVWDSLSPHDVILWIKWFATVAFFIFFMCLYLFFKHSLNTYLIICSIFGHGNLLDHWVSWKIQVKIASDMVNLSLIMFFYLFMFIYVFFKNDFVSIALMCMCVLVWVWVHEWTQCLQRPEEYTTSPRDGVTENCEPSSLGARIWTWVLCLTSVCL